MPVRPSFDYAVLRVVPRVEREEFVNAGVVLLCLQREFLEACVEMDRGRVRALHPDADLAAIEEHLAVIPRIAAGDPAAGPIARLTLRERFHWLVSPKSTMLQVSPVHTGLCDDPAATLQQLMSSLVRG